MPGPTQGAGLPASMADRSLPILQVNTFCQDLQHRACACTNSGILAQGGAKSSGFHGDDEVRGGVGGAGEVGG